MAPQKSPAFSFYAKDFLTGTSSMSLQEVGAYIRLLAYQWDSGSVPGDASERACVLGCAKAQERELWKKVGKKFTARDDVFINERLEEERQKQVERRQRLSDNGSKGAESKWRGHGKGDGPAIANAIDSPMAPTRQTDGLPSSSSFSSSGTDSSIDESVGERARLTHLIPRNESRNWDRRHGNHLSGFCDWVCFDMSQVDEFAGKIPGADLGLKRQQIKEWAGAIRALWADKIVPDGSNFDFWRNRWTEQHGGSRPANATLKAAKAANDLDEAFR